MAENQLGGQQYMVLPEGASRLLGKEGVYKSTRMKTLLKL